MFNGAKIQLFLNKTNNILCKT